MRSRSYFLGQAEQCRKLARQAEDRLVASRLKSMADEYETLARDMAQAAGPREQVSIAQASAN